MRNAFLPVAALVLLFTSCGNNDKPEGETKTLVEDTPPPPPSPGPIELLGNDLLGAWKVIGGNMEIYEVWQKTNDSTYAGKCFMVKGKDTSVQETMELRTEGKDIYYVPTVIGQNNDKPVSFKLISSSNHTMVFENPGHDFPQSIAYKMMSADSLIASIYGKTNGKEHIEYFPMARIK
jgi:hypothetical protein